MAVPLGPTCPALYVLGVQGTGQSSPNADPTADTGVVGALVGQVINAVPNLVQRSYIGYDAGFGGAVPGGGAEPYARSVGEAADLLRAAAAQIGSDCPATLLAAVGYSQGAQAVAEFAQDVGAGNGPVPADRIAGIALYSNPTRTAQSPVFPGRPGQSVPDPAPGTPGTAVSSVQIANPTADGAGLADEGATYGALTGRVADICVDGDLACSAPDRAALLRVGAEIAAQADLRDPLAALGSIQGLLSAALGNAWTTVVLDDFQIEADNADYLPHASLAQRLIDAADPRIPTPDPVDRDAAAARWNELISALGVNPLGVLPKLAGQLSAAWGQLLADNADLVNPAVLLRFVDTVARHNGYASTGQILTGTGWFIALAHDLAGGRS
ncbi:cutinase family protein [Nocardia sp. NPDC059246]